MASPNRSPRSMVRRSASSNCKRLRAGLFIARVRAIESIFGDESTPVTE